jgi:xanthine dehydrogenase YagR molybdenum-binding subunit
MAEELKMPPSVMEGPGGTTLATWGDPKDLKVVGKPLPRRGALEKVTGRAVYPYDVHLPNMTYAFILRSARAHARITAVGTAAAEKLPGVRLILTPFNAPKIPWTDERLLFDPVVRFVGQEFGAVVADDEDTAEEAARMVRVKYDDLPAAIEPEDALKPGAAPVQPGTNVFDGKPAVYQRGDPDKGFAEADLVYEQSYTTSVQHHTALELHGCVAQWEGGSLTLWDSNQGVHLVRDVLAARLKLPINRVRIVNEYVGAGYGSKNGPKPYHVVAAMLAQRVGRPVKLFANREDNFPTSQHRPKTIQTYKVGVKKDGTIAAMTYKIIGQCGPFKENAVWATRGGDATRQLYRCPNLRTEAIGAHTNTQAPVPCRGPGDTENMYTLELFMDEVAERLGMDPIEFRKRNYTEADQIHNEPYSSNGLLRCYELGAKAFGWNPPRPGSTAGPRKRGVGVGAVIWHGTGTEQSQVTVVLQADGTAQLLAGISNIGAGAETSLCQVVAEELGIPAEAVNLSLGDTANHPYTINTSAGSRTTSVASPAARNAAADAKRQLIALAARLMNAEAKGLELVDGQIRSKSDPGKFMAFKDVAAKMGRELIIGTGRRPANPKGYSVWLFGAHFAEVEVDTETGQVRVVRAACVHDAGRWLNPKIIESQIQGGFLQGMGMALTEERIMDHRSGHQLNTNLHEYSVPTSMEVPAQIVAIDPGTLDLATNTNVKGLGEPPLVGAGGALANAVYNAIGVRIRDYPITPNKILAALKAKA